ncbi:MAG TPA: polyprenol phosphomannose-dependent alpha 1,6 mannosyltransferase MptB [Solirubrobacteraceae bacterium]|nr:polyprenol phosphomannose-dependent alpha 1,6 mannosyltransferase MptB [Solirubrobacteraceae bacterium]
MTSRDGLVAASPRGAAGPLALGGVVVLGFWLAAGAAGHTRATALIPATRHAHPGWLLGPLSGLHVVVSTAGAGELLLGMLACYAVAVACADAVSVRWAIAAVLAAHAVFLVAPPLYSADVFSYLDYGRLGTGGINPYTHGALFLPNDPVHPFVLFRNAGSPYGPIFTVLTYPLSGLSVPAGLWILKSVAALSSLGGLVFVWRICERLDRPPVPAILLVGLNPLLLAYGVAGAHNDLLMMLVAIAGVWLVVSGREAAGGAAGVAAVAMKASTAVLVPFLVLGARSRSRALAGGLVAVVAVVALAAAAFGGEVVKIASQIGSQQHLESHYSLPVRVGHWIGEGGAPGWLRALFVAAFLVAFAWTLWRTWRGADWIEMAGWAMLALLLSTAWLLPWYPVWLLPLAAIAPGNRLRFAALAFSAFVLVARVWPLLL